MTTTNPAQLLGTLLTTGNAKADEILRATNSQPACPEVWEATFGASGGVPLARRLNEMHRLPAEIRSEFDARRLRTAASIMGPLDKIEAGGLIAGSAQWMAYWAQIDGDHAVPMLEMASELLSAPSNLTGPDITDPIQLHETAGELLQAVTESDLAPEAKRVITSYLLKIMTVLASEATYSTGAMWHEIEAFVGRAAVDPVVQEAIKHPTVGEWLRKFIASCIVGGALMIGPVNVSVDVKVNVNFGSPDPSIVQMISPKPPPAQLGAGSEQRALPDGDDGIAEAEIVQPPGAEHG